MLDEKGHIKIADFGICNSVTGNFSKLRKTVIGTVQYMAPEVFENTGYSFSYDVWTLGCLLYELVVGEPPFGVNSVSSKDIRRELVNKEVQMKDYFSKDFKRLLYGLLEKNVS